MVDAAGQADLPPISFIQTSLRGSAHQSDSQRCLDSQIISRGLTTPKRNQLPTNADQGSSFTELHSRRERNETATPASQLDQLLYRYAPQTAAALGLLQHGQRTHGRAPPPLRAGTQPSSERSSKYQRLHGHWLVYLTRRGLHRMAISVPRRKIHTRFPLRPRQHPKGPLELKVNQRSHRSLLSRHRELDGVGVFGDAGFRSSRSQHHQANRNWIGEGI